MILFALCINSLLYYLYEGLQRLCANGTQQKTTVIASSDVSFLVTSQEDVRTARGGIACCEKATGATPDVAKTSALAVGRWHTSGDIMGIPYSEEIKILVVKMWKTVKQSALASWTRSTSLVNTQSRRGYSTDLNIAQRITCRGLRGLLEKYPTFGREKESGLLGALDT